MLHDGLFDWTRIDWMPEALRILREELPNIDVMISSQYSRCFADGLSKGKSMRRFFGGKEVCRVAYRVLVKEPLRWFCPVTTVSLRSNPSARKI